MKIVNAVWDQRNFGIRCAEIELETADRAEVVITALKEAEKEYDYIALKVPSPCVELTKTVSDLHYTYVEDMMFFEHDLHEIKRSPIQQRLYDSVKVSEMTEDDFSILFKEIDSGSFSFDRISNDPYFSRDLSISRFHNWLNDERERGAIFMKATIKGEMSGFFTIRHLGDGVYNSALGGAFIKFRKGGLGSLIQAHSEVKKRGGKKLILGVSTNNMAQIRAVIQNGFFPKCTNHVFIKHTDI